MLSIKKQSKIQEKERKKLRKQDLDEEKKQVLRSYFLYSHLCICAIMSHHKNFCKSLLNRLDQVMYAVTGKHKAYIHRYIVIYTYTYIIIYT